MEQTAWRTLGRVAEDKDQNSTTIKIFSPELLPHYRNTLQDNTTAETVVTTNPHDNEEINIRLNTTNIIEAEYFNRDTNSSCPDVRKGEQVWLVTYGIGSDKYYWEETGNTDHLRRLETRLIRVSDSKDIDKELSEENCYTFLMDTLRSKRVMFKTAKSDGEEFAYIFEIDANDNTVTIADDVGNEILLESKTPRIRLRNKDTTTVDLNGKSIFCIAPEDITMVAKRQMVMKTPTLTVENTGGGGVTEFNTNALAINAKETTINGNTIGLNAPVKAPKDIVTTHIRSQSSSTGSCGEAYGAATTDIVDGSGKAAEPKADDGDGGATNRQSAAWEQIKPAIDLIVDALDEVHEKIGISTKFREALTLAINSKMPKNRGE